MDLVDIFVLAAFLLAGAGAILDLIFKPKLIVRMAMVFGYLLVLSLASYILFETDPPALPFIGGCVLFAIAGALFVTGWNWVRQKITQSAIDRITEFDRKDREPGQLY